MSSTLATSVALLAVPIGVGALVGVILRRLRGRRFRGFVAAVGLVFLPAAALVGLTIRFPIVGLWDAGVEGLLFGAGVLWKAHRALAERGKVILAASSVVVSLCVLELGSRLFLPPPPAFPIRGGPHLLLADALRGDLTHQPWDTLSKEIVCSIVYGDQYSGILDISDSLRDVVTPRTFVPRADASRRVLHLGDSMAFGFGLPRNQTFTAELERLEPGVQHINAAIPGTAPDAYLAVLQRWLDTHKIDLVVMHIFEGNDLDGLDSHSGCCDWQSLLVYRDGVANLRCLQATEPNLGLAGFDWLRYHNPPPYILRALVGTSSAAAYVAAVMALEPYFLVDQPLTTRLKHLEAIVRASRDLCAARHIRFVVDVLPTRSWLEDRVTWQHYAPSILSAAQQADVPAIDPSDVLRDAVVQGQPVFFEPGDIHYTASAHALLARWLHERLATAADSPPTP